MENQILTDFKGKVNDITFSDKNVYNSTKFLLYIINERFGECYTDEFIKMLKESIDFAYKSMPTSNIGQFNKELMLCINAAESFNEIHFAAFGNDNIFENLNNLIQYNYFNFKEEQNMKKDLMEVINERINATEQQKFTLVPTELLEKETGLSREELNTEIGKLLQDKKLFYFIEKEDKIAFNGEIKEVSNRKAFFNNKENFEEYSKKHIEFKNSNKQKAAEQFTEKKEKVVEMGDNFQKIFNAVNDLTFKHEPQKAYVELKEVRNAVGLEYNEFNECLNKLKEEKILYSTTVKKIVEHDGKDAVDEKNVLTHSSHWLSKTLDREALKNDLNLEQGKDFSKLPKLKDLEKERKTELAEEKEKTESKNKNKTKSKPKKSEKVMTL